MPKKTKNIYRPKKTANPLSAPKKEPLILLVSSFIPDMLLNLNSNLGYVHIMKGLQLDRRQSLFYFVPQESHSQAGLATENPT